MHKGIRRAHIGTNALVRKVMHYGYFWPTIQEDVREMVRTYNKFQIRSSDHHVSQNEYYCMGSPVLFAQWGMDLLGPFPKAQEERTT